MTHLGFRKVPCTAVNTALEEMHLSKNHLVVQAFELSEEVVYQCKSWLELLRFELSVDIEVKSSTSNETGWDSAGVQAN